MSESVKQPRPLKTTYCLSPNMFESSLLDAVTKQRSSQDSTLVSKSKQASQLDQTRAKALRFQLMEHTRKNGFHGRSLGGNKGAIKFQDSSSQPVSRIELGTATTSTLFSQFSVEPPFDVSKLADSQRSIHLLI